MNNYEEMKALREARELARNVEYAQKSAYTITDGIVRWDSNNQVPPADMVEAIATFESSVDVEASKAAREVDNAAFIAQYIKNQSNRSEEQIREERFEARAAMGPGVEMVNIITGEKYTT
jgi:hypothetical protein